MTQKLTDPRDLHNFLSYADESYKNGFIKLTIDAGEPLTLSYTRGGNFSHGEFGDVYFEETTATAHMYVKVDGLLFSIDDIIAATAYEADANYSHYAPMDDAFHGASKWEATRKEMVGAA